MSGFDGSASRDRMTPQAPETFAAARRMSGGNGAPPLRRAGNAHAGRVGRPKPKRAWLLAAGGAILIASLGLSWFASSESAAQTEVKTRILAVRTVTVQPVSSYQAVREYTGAIVAGRTSALGFELAGKLTELHVNEGDSVAAGGVLAQLDTEHLETSRRKVVAKRAQAVAQLDEMIAGPRAEDIAASRARVESLQAQVELLKLKTARHKKLLASNATSHDEFEQHAFGLKASEAHVNEARHDLEELLNGTRKERIEAQRAVVAELEAGVAEIDVDLRKSILTAPFDGTIARRLADDGTVVEAGRPVFRLVEDRVLEAWIGLPAHATTQLNEASPVRVTIHGEHFAATVAGLFPEVDSATRTRTVVLQLDSSAAQRVVQGQVVRLETEETVQADGFWLPSTALTKGARGLWTAFVAEEVAGESEASPGGSLRVARRDLEILHTQSDRVLVRGTLNPGDRVIAGGTHRVVPGQFVRPLN